MMTVLLQHESAESSWNMLGKFCSGNGLHCTTENEEIEELNGKKWWEKGTLL